MQASTQIRNFRLFALPQLLFHLSLTVLVHYRWENCFRLWGWSPDYQTSYTWLILLT